LAGRCTEKSAEAAAKEEIVGAGEGCRVGKPVRQVERGVVGTQCDGDDPKDERAGAGEQAELDEGGDTTNAEDQNWPEDVELLFNLKRPEVLDVERVQIEMFYFPES